MGGKEKEWRRTEKRKNKRIDGRKKEERGGQGG